MGLIFTKRRGFMKNSSKVTHKQTTHGFWLWWLLATLIGIAVGMVIVFLGLSALLNNSSQVVYGVVIGGVFGTTVGMSQWVVLRRYFDRVGWWILLTIVGWVVFWVLNIMNLLVPAKRIAFIPDLLNLAILGIILGVLQWLLLRQKIQSAGWWVLANIVGTILGSLFADAINTALQSDSPIDFLTSSIIWAIITGVSMMWLIKQSSSLNTGTKSI
jgi:uncharacterized membrane-anchored protein